jgi:hypothetical protein
MIVRGNTHHWGYHLEYSHAMHHEWSLCEAMHDFVRQCMTGHDRSAVGDTAVC